MTHYFILPNYKLRARLQFPQVVQGDLLLRSTPTVLLLGYEIGIPME